jgi:hypothetical protein
MNGIDALRKNYDRLNPEERAALMVDELATRGREHVIRSLGGVDAWEARNAIWYQLGMVTVAALVATQSLLEERFPLTLGAIVALKDHGNGAPGEQMADAILKAFDARVAWRHALCQLEKETGLPFTKAAYQFGGQEYLEFDFDEEKKMTVDFSTQLEVLREIWRAFSGWDRQTN